MGNGGLAGRDPLRAKHGLHVDVIPGPCTKTCGKKYSPTPNPP